MSHADVRDPVERLAEEFAQRLRRGERPSLSEYTDRHPELADEIRDVFPALVVMEQFGSVADPRTADLPPAVGGAAPAVLGEFRIVREIGRGGMGVVYEAVQESLGRHVALKVLPVGPRSQGTFLKRFRREAQAAARLHHTNIVPVFGVGAAGGAHYYAMQYIHGQGLDVVLAEVRRLRGSAGTPYSSLPSPLRGRGAGGEGERVPSAPTPLPQGTRGALAASAPLANSGRGETVISDSSTPSSLAGQPEARYCREVARLGVQAADALHYAHGQGVLHRDIKPSNMLLDTRGTVWVTDFGLAKADDSDDLTETGDLVGTLRYMAPERFRGTADARSDVYSLGVTLYEMLTLRPPFERTDRLQLMERIARGDPPRPRQIDPHVPRELETVVLKAMAADPADRYGTAGALADDLRRFLADRPVHARRHTLREQAWRWCRRNPAVAALAAVVVLLLAAAAVGAGLAALSLGAALADARANLNRALTAEVDAETNRWRGLLLDARASRLSRASGQRFVALASLRRAVEIARMSGMPAERFDELRTEAIAALALPDLYVERWWDGRPPRTRDLDFTSDLATYARLDGDGSVSVRRVADDTELYHLPALNGAAGVRLNPDGRSLLQFRPGGKAGGRLWDLSVSPPVVRGEVSDLDIYPRYRPDGRLIALPHSDGAISVYEPETGQRLYHLPPVAVSTKAWVDLHPGAPLISVSSYFHREVLIRDLSSGAVVARLTPPWPGGGYAVWHPSGRTLCVAQGDGNEVRVYDFDAAANPPALTFRRSFHSPSGGGTEIAFNRTGEKAVGFGWGGTFGLIDFPTGRVLFETPTAHLGRPQFGVGGRLAGTGRPPGPQIGLWSFADGRECRVLAHGREPFARPPAISPDGRLAAVSFSAEGLVLFELVTGREVAVLPYRTTASGRLGSCTFDSSGTLVTNSWDGCYRWPAQTDPSDPGRLRLGPPERLPFSEGINPVAVGGRVVAQAMYNGYGMQAHAGGWVLHPDRPGDPRRILAGESIATAAVSADGRWVAFGLHDSTEIRVFEAATGRQVWAVAGSVRCQFTADGRWLATAAEGGRLYAVGTWEPGPQLGSGELADISADGRLAVLATSEGHFRLVEIPTGRELARLEDPEHHAGLASLTPDGARLVALSRDGVRVWDLRAIRRELAEMGLDWDAPPYVPESPAGPLDVQLVGIGLLDRDTRSTWTLLEATWKLLANPDDIAARRDRAAAARQRDWPWLANHDYTEFLERRPDDRTAHFQRGLIHLRQDRAAEALADFEAILAHDPADGPARYRRALALIQLERFRDAVADLDVLIPRYPTESHLYQMRGDCLTKRGDTGRAATDLAQAQRGLSDADAANNTAWHYVTGPPNLRDPAQALALAQKAVALSPDTWSYRNTLGVALYRLGRYAEAAQSLTLSLEHAGGEAAGFDLYFLAACRYRLGDPAAAHDTYNSAIRWERRVTPTSREVEELTAIRAEVRAVLAGH